jgi:hypothetical protein
MSQAVLFEIGAVIFVVVSTSVFLYGQAWFRDWEERDVTRAEVVLSPGTSETTLRVVTALSTVRDETSAAPTSTGAA